MDPQEAWAKLKIVYKIHIPAKQALLKQMLKNTVLKDDKDIQKFIDKVKLIAIDISSSRGFINNIDIVDAILEGLPESYVTAKVYLNT